MSSLQSSYQKILTQIAKEEGMKMESFSFDWAHRLTKGEEVRYIVGYQFPLNDAGALEICKDKVLTYGFLTDNGVPAAMHLLMPNDSVSMKMERTDLLAIGDQMLKMCKKVVIKDNYGTGGNSVFLAENLIELNEALDKILAGSYAAALSPYYDIQEEYRVILLDGQPMLTIRKDRAFVTGDGKSTVADLLKDREDAERLTKNMKEEDLQYVPAENEKRYLNWKHNLGQGAKGVIVEDKELFSLIHPIAKKAVEVVGARFASVDIIETKTGFMVLEINSGVMMEHLSSQSEEYFAKAKEIYRAAVLKMFEK